MKAFRTLLIIGAISAAFALEATTQSDSPKTQEKAAAVTQKALKPVKSSVSARPRVPSRQVVTCAYDGEYLMFDFVVPEGECNVVVTEWFSNAQQSYTIDSSTLTADIHVGELYESTVTVTTEKGNVYTADLTAE